jgi:type I restriction enzyme, S subunit
MNNRSLTLTSWPRTTLGEAADIGAGQGAPQDPLAFGRTGYHFIRAASLATLCDVNGGPPLERIEEPVAKKHRLRLYPTGTVVFAKSGMSATKNRIYRLERPAYVVNHLATVEPHAELDATYLRYWLEKYNPTRLIQDDSYPSIALEGIAEVRIPLPAIPVQRRIAELLDKADQLRRMRRYALELSDQFLPALFLRMFGDPAANPKGFSVAPAGKLFHIQLGKMLDEKRYTGRQLRPYLGNANVQWGYFDLADVKQMDFPPDDFEKFRLRVDDILVCEGGEVGRTAIWRGEIPDCCYQKAVHRLRLKTNQIRPDYFQWYMWTAVASGLVARETSTSTIGHFTAERFEVFPIVVPPAKVQDGFVGAVAAHREHQSTLREAMRQAEHLFQSLLNQYFGEEI